MRVRSEEGVESTTLIPAYKYLLIWVAEETSDIGCDGLSAPKG